MRRWDFGLTAAFFLISLGQFPAACGVQLVAVALRATDRRWDSGGYLEYPAACGGVLYSVKIPPAKTIDVS